MSVLIETQDLKKYFKTPRGWLHAVDGIDFQIQTGSTLGVVGESGCGKSTLGRAVLRLHEPTSGNIFYEGKDLMALKKSEMRRMCTEMQMIFQDVRLAVDRGADADQSYVRWRQGDAEPAHRGADGYRGSGEAADALLSP